MSIRQISGGFEVIEIRGADQPDEALEWLPRIRQLHRQANLPSAGNTLSTHTALLTHEDMLIGAIHGYSPTEKTLWVSRLAVDEDARGQGFGRALLAYSARQWLNPEGLVSLSPTSGALAFYEHLGFQFDETQSYLSGRDAVWSVAAQKIIGAAGTTEPASHVD